LQLEEDYQDFNPQEDANDTRRPILISYLAAVSQFSSSIFDKISAGNCGLKRIKKIIKNSSCEQSKQ
jgi:hypothetical protein